MYDIVNEKLFRMLPMRGSAMFGAALWVNRAPTCHGPWPPFGAERTGRLDEVA